MAASVLFSSNTFEKMKKFFELAAIPFVSKSSFYRIQGKYLFSVANEAWLNEQGGILNAIIKENSCCLSGNGRLVVTNAPRLVTRTEWRSMLLKNYWVKCKTTK